MKISLENIRDYGRVQKDKVAAKQLSLLSASDWLTF